MIGTAAVDYLILNTKHRTNEDWVLDLPLSLSVEDLIGSTVSCQLRDKMNRSITLNCAIQGTTITTRLGYPAFDNMEGNYTGDVLLMLSGNRAMVTHIINLDLARGVSFRG